MADRIELKPDEIALLLMMAGRGRPPAYSDFRLERATRVLVIAKFLTPKPIHEITAAGTAWLDEEPAHG